MYTYYESYVDTFLKNFDENFKFINKLGDKFLIVNKAYSKTLMKMLKTDNAW